MSRKAECPGCNSYTSGVQLAIMGARHRYPLAEPTAEVEA